MLAWITLTPIVGTTCTPPFNNNKIKNTKRYYFPLVPICACAITIHKSWWVTSAIIVYGYGKMHSQQLVYVALSKVTRIETLHIVTENKNSTFFEGWGESISITDLQNEFGRLSFDRLQTVTAVFTNFIFNGKGISIY